MPILPDDREKARAELTGFLAANCTLLVVLRDDPVLVRDAEALSSNPMLTRMVVGARRAEDVVDLLETLPDQSGGRRSALRGAWLASLKVVRDANMSFVHVLRDVADRNERRPDDFRIAQAFLAAEKA